MKKNISLLLSTLILFVSIISHVKLDVRAATTGSWSTSPIENGYQYIKNTKNSNSKNYAITSKNDVNGVYQGIDNMTFAKEAPIATIYINESMIDRVAAAQNLGSGNENAYLKVEKLWNPNNGLAKYLTLGSPTKVDGFNDDYGHNYLMFNQALARDENAQGPGIGLIKDGDNYIPGNIVSYTFKDAAEFEGEKADVVITYSNLHIVLQSNIGDYTGSSADSYKALDKFLICSGNDVRVDANNVLVKDASGSYYQRYGIKVDATVQVLKKDGSVADGVFYFKSADIDVYRGNGYDKLGSSNDNDNSSAKKNMNYSEQVQVNSGFFGTGYDIYLPGGTNDEATPLNPKYKAHKTNYSDNNFPPGYRAVIKKDGSKYLFQPQKPEVKDEQDSIYSGFLAPIDNKKGVNVTVWSSGAKEQSVATFLLAGNAGGTTTGTWYNLKSSTETVGGPKPDTGGNIQTTSQGNKNGNLSDGGRILGPTTLTVSGGRTVTYTLTPEVDKGYVLKSLTIKNGGTDYTVPEEPGKNPGDPPKSYAPYEIDVWSAGSGSHTDRNYSNLNVNQTEELEYTVSVNRHPVTNEPLSYTFTFKNIQQDHAIHVVWQKKYQERYKFLMDNKTTPVPPEIEALLPDRNTPGKEQRFYVNEQIAPAVPKERSKIVSDGGVDYKYTFLDYYEDDYPTPYTYKENVGSEYYTTDAGGVASTRTTEARDILFTGYWKRARAYTEIYKYRYYKADGTTPVDATEMPNDVKDSIPTRSDKYGDGEEVSPASPKNGLTYFEGSMYIYRFRGWKDSGENETYDLTNPAKVNGGDVEFYGIWVRIPKPVDPPIYSATYKYKDSGSLPPEVLSTLPYDPVDYLDGATVGAKPPVRGYRVVVGTDVWIFEGWDEDSKVISGSNVEFVGEWRKLQTFTEHYSYDGTLPQAVMDTLPTRADRYLNGRTVTPADPTRTTVQDGIYTWRFLGWDATPSDAIINNDDVRFVGRWVREGGPGPSPGGGGGIGGGGDEDPPATPAPTDPPAPVTPPTGETPETFVPSTESDGTDTTDGSSGLTIPEGESGELTITPVLPEGVDPGSVEKVLVSGVPLSPDLFTVKGHSVVLSPAYLNLLPEGTYTVRIIYQNVWTEASFAVLGARRPSSMGAVQSARTGDITYGWPVFFAITGATSTAALCGLLRRRKRMK